MTMMTMMIMMIMMTMMTMVMTMMIMVTMTGWQNLAAFRQGQNGQVNFRQARIYNFRDKCVVFARNRKFANLTQ